MKLFVFVFVSFMSFTCIYTASGQSGQLFEVISLPRKSGYSKTQLNSEIAGATTIKQVVAIVNKKKALKNISIILRSVNRSGDNIWWTINSPDSKDQVVNWIVQQSKFSSSDIAYNLNDLKTIFTDTVFVLDTLKIGFAMQGTHYNNDGFYLIGKCNADADAQKISLSPRSDGYFIITSNLTGCPGPFFYADLYNSNNSARILASPVFFFANDEVRQMLTDMAIYLHGKNGETIAKDIASDMYPFVRAHYGVISFTALSDWVNKTLANPLIAHD